MFNKPTGIPDRKNCRPGTFESKGVCRPGVRARFGDSPWSGIRTIVDAQGLRTTARQLRVSRSKLAKMLENELAECTTAFLQRLSREIQKVGIAAFAHQIDWDPSNLSKAISGQRNVSAALAERLRKRFDPDPGIA